MEPRHNHPMQTDTHPQNPRSPGSLHMKGIITLPTPTIHYFFPEIPQNYP